ncbi:hypothetical protein QDZ26_004268, partial [Pluralibacter gergoviae]
NAQRGRILAAARGRGKRQSPLFFLKSRDCGTIRHIAANLLMYRAFFAHFYCAYFLLYPVIAIMAAAAADAALGFMMFFYAPRAGGAVRIAIQLPDNHCPARF